MEMYLGGEKKKKDCPGDALKIGRGAEILEGM